MNLVKAGLLGTAAALACTAAAAADLPAREAAPVDDVRVCDFTGAGFFSIPGTDTCLQVGGLVRVEAAFIDQTRAYYPTATVGQASRLVAAGSTVIGRDQDASGFWTQGRLTVDARTQTAYGTLRSYVRTNINRYQGLYQFGGVAGGSNSYANQGGNSAVLGRGFIAFAGMTAGRVQSFFDFYADIDNYEHIAGSNIVLPVLAYTAKLGAGLTATLSV